MAGNWFEGALASAAFLVEVGFEKAALLFAKNNILKMLKGALTEFGRLVNIPVCLRRV